MLIRLCGIYCFFMFFQNALRAVVEFHSESTDLPKVDVLICRGKEDLTIKVRGTSFSHSVWEGVL